MKVQGQKYIGFTPEKYQTLLALLESLNPVTMPLIKSLSFLPTQHTLVINFSLSLFLGFLLVVLQIIFVHP